VRHMLTYKAQRMGMHVVLQEERSTSRTCPVCCHCRKSKPKGRLFHCTNTACGWSFHRDGVGAINIRKKYREEFGIPLVVGVMAPPTSMRYAPHARVAHGARMGTFLWEPREAARL
jgi:putative transposase